jgi:hypothetical protein
MLPFFGYGSRGRWLCGSIAGVIGGLVMRWILLLVAVTGLALAFSAKTPGLLGLGLLLGIGCLLASLFGFAAERVASSARQDIVLLTDKDINLLRASIRKPGATPPGNMSPANSA